jgi:exodeoxyribonuclease VII large subunit
LQFVAESMQRSGDGALMEQFLRLKAKLQAQGLFDAERKRALPAFPLRVGVVTSLGGAALHDVASAFARRAPHVQLIVYPSLVQGAQAPASLVQALATASRRAEVDLLIVCRGGGSLEDLWSFNDEAVVRAVAACPMPVVSGVGHETDISLVDFCADLRAPTPTAAAELAAPSTAEALAALDALATHLLRCLHAQTDRQAQRLDRLALQLSRPADAMRQAASRLGLLAQRLAAAPQRWRERTATRLDQAAARLQQARRSRTVQDRHRLEGLAIRLSAANPEQVLGRGYAWLADAQGVPVVSARAVQVGQALDAVWADGRAQVRVAEVSVGPARSRQGPAAPAD